MMEDEQVLRLLVEPSCLCLMGEGGNGKPTDGIPAAAFPSAAPLPADHRLQPPPLLPTSLRLTKPVPRAPRAPAAMAALTGLAAAVRALQHELRQSALGTAQEDSATTVLDSRQAVALPLISSGMLLVVFLAFKYVQWFLLFGACIAAVAAIAFTFQPLLEAAAERGGWRWHRRQLALPSCCCCCGAGAKLQLAVQDVLLYSAGCACMVGWLASGSILLNNVSARLGRLAMRHLPTLHSLVPRRSLASPSASASPACSRCPT